MKLTGNLKEQVEQATSKEEALNIIEYAGMELTKEELEMVAGGDDCQLAWTLEDAGRLTIDDPQKMYNPYDRNIFWENNSKETDHILKE